MRHLTILFVLLAILVSCTEPASENVQQDRMIPLDRTPRLAILAAYQPEIDALLPSLTGAEHFQVNGVTFHTGRIEGIDVVILMTGMSLVNAAMNTQLAIDHFEINAILVSGVAGGVDPDLTFGDVAVPARWGQYSEMVFMREIAPETYARHADSGPEIASYLFMRPRGLRVANSADPAPVERQFWFDVDEELMAVAETAAILVEFEQCVDTENCLERPPIAALGGNGVSGSFFQDNAAFREYLFETFDAQVVEMETSAIATVAYANDIPFIGFRSLSDLAGGGRVNEYQIFQSLAAKNAAAFLRAFLIAYGTKP